VRLEGLYSKCRILSCIWSIRSNNLDKATCVSILARAAPGTRGFEDSNRGDPQACRRDVGCLSRRRYYRACEGLRGDEWILVLARHFEGRVALGERRLVFCSKHGE
jgi:hypothetical protein